MNCVRNVKKLMQFGSIHFKAEFSEVTEGDGQTKKIITILRRVDDGPHLINMFTIDQTRRGSLYCNSSIKYSTCHHYLIPVINDKNKPSTLVFHFGFHKIYRHVSVSIEELIGDIDNRIVENIVVFEGGVIDIVTNFIREKIIEQHDIDISFDEVENPYGFDKHSSTYRNHVAAHTKPLDEFPADSALVIY